MDNGDNENSSIDITEKRGEENKESPDRGNTVNYEFEGDVSSSRIQNLQSSDISNTHVSAISRCENPFRPQRSDGKRAYYVRCSM